LERAIEGAIEDGGGKEIFASAPDHEKVRVSVRWTGCNLPYSAEYLVKLNIFS
jgi:hypothetical protein